MKDIIHTLQLAFTAIGGYIGWFLGGYDGLVLALVAFVVIDYITGLMAAVIEKKLSSSIGFRGIFKKVLIFSLVGIGHIIDYYLIEKGSAVRTAVIFFYLSNEGLSIIENASKVGLPIPEKLRVVFTELRREDRKNG
ncbi:phage holin family protein [Desulfoscipio gibsoniae]|jgi:toxin secretion/phage lysis holin|uniref:Toxin secretion/phage lysis holin n=1 Tax=Desulfoscipio gibsoniae DSM 7213 TaxID=767817 RepID=R4KVM0_9FIRM|nr:phage holin family protein [Desulfoscipio gibsoniae]AGL03671.1 toxin secretion/phage lysis holin [Desulfoscipio gibsoniae DSM 7213]